MISRYLGNKQSIMPDLLEVIGRYAGPGDHVADVFSGSLSVSLGLKRAGYRVTSNDINLFSSILAQAYLVPDEPPSPAVADLLGGSSAISSTRNEAAKTIGSLLGVEGFTFLGEENWRTRFEDFLCLLHHLENVTYEGLPQGYRRTDFFDAYSEEGRFSAYVSSRGSAGRRRFFTGQNARRIDLILNQLRAWKVESCLDTHTYSLLLAVLLRSVERVSNTQGTYHDFPRRTWDSRALNPIRLDPPPLDRFLGGAGGHVAGREIDSLEFMSSVESHRVLYLDPPYNFRQYSAYYFLPNVICRYAEIEDLDGYFSSLKHVRGQNPADDFTSTFCKPRQFIGDLSSLIDRADCDAVVISYFTGKNHWSEFDSDRSDTGHKLISELLSGPRFVSGSLRVDEVSRRNYASYGGFAARTVDEQMFSARLRHDGEHETAGRVRDRVQNLASVGLPTEG